MAKAAFQRYIVMLQNMEPWMERLHGKYLWILIFTNELTFTIVKTCKFAVPLKKIFVTYFFYFKERSTKKLTKQCKIFQIFPASLETEIRIIWKFVQNIIVRELSSSPIPIKSLRYEYKMALTHSHNPVV